MGADADDQPGALLVGEQHRRRPGWCPPPAATWWSSPSRSSRSRPGRAPVRIGVDDQLGAAAKRLVARRVHVAEDHVGPEPRLQDRVGAAVDADQHRAHVADVGAERAQVLAVGRAPDDDQRVAVAERGARAAAARFCPASSSPSSRRWVIVFSANAASASSIRSRWSESCSASSAALQHAARRQHRPVAANLAARRSSPDRRPEAPRTAAPRARRSAARRPAPGAAGRRSGSGRSTNGATLTTARTPLADQVLGGDPVEVGVVDDRDVRGAEALDQLLGPAPEPGAAVDRGIGALRRRGRCASAGRARGFGRAWPSDALIIRKAPPEDSMPASRRSPRAA